MKKTLFLLLALSLMVMLLVGCAAEKGKTVEAPDLEAFFAEQEGKYEMGALADLDAEMLEAYYPGLTEYEFKQIVAKAPMMSAVVSEYVLVECQSEEDAKAVAEIFETRKKTQAEGGAWYPESMEAWGEAHVFQSGTVAALIANKDAGGEITAALEAALAG